MTLLQQEHAITKNSHSTINNSINEEKNDIDNDDDIINRIFGQQPVPYLELIAGMNNNDVKNKRNDENKKHQHPSQSSFRKLQQQDKNKILNSTPEAKESTKTSIVPVNNTKNNKNNKSSNVPVASVTKPVQEEADDIQLVQREQMEEAISQMVQQMKIKTNHLHTTITKQTSNIVNELETLTEDNVHAVTTLANDTTKQLSKSWKSSISTYITIICLVCIFLLILLTIIIIPKKQKQKIVYIVQKQPQQQQQIQPVSLPKIIQQQEQQQQPIALLPIEIPPFSEKYKSVPIPDLSMLLVQPVANDIHPIEIQPYSDKYGSRPPTTLAAGTRTRTIQDEIYQETIELENRHYQQEQEQKQKYNHESATKYFRDEL